MPVATRPGAYYLGDLRPHITSEKGRRAIEKRKSRRSNTYYGSMPSPWASLEFAFEWELEAGDVDLEGKTSKPPRISWTLSFNKTPVLWGKVRANTQQGRALVDEISKSEAAVAALLADLPGGNPKAQAVAYIQDVRGRIDGQTFVVPPGDDLATYIAGL